MQSPCYVTAHASCRSCRDESKFHYLMRLAASNV